MKNQAPDSKSGHVDSSNKAPRPPPTVESENPEQMLAVQPDSAAALAPKASDSPDLGSSQRQQAVLAMQRTIGNRRTTQRLSAQGRPAQRSPASSAAAIDTLS